MRLQIGKIRRDAAKAGEGTCGCGASIRDCPLWGRFIERRATTARPVEDLQLVIGIMRELSGPDVVLVDASKIREPIGELAAQRASAVKVIHLSRDYRSWIVSAVDLRRRKEKRERPGWWLGLEGARRWTRENRKLQTAIAAAGFPSMRLGYEELVLAPARIWPLVRDFLGLPDAGVPDDIDGACSHMFSGNRMRENKNRRAVSYDERWFGRDEWRLAERVWPPLRAANRRWTYSHGILGPGADEVRSAATADCGGRR